ncbi:hypothetical protein NQ317_009360 [Molorchus minor]|uniref:peptidylprolyl isomerase n=1 Tax=Molorchus minor TaxID=1323400 RepID=A0ABQ9JL71_9CUCU|nr:hypothetical protein NQ317_009360 [Molorchus minor]
MKLNEKSQFLFKPEYAYGKLGCLNRVPPDSEVLFEIELMEIINSAAATSFQNLPPDQQKQFAFPYVLKEKDLYSKNVTAAIREYNTAVGKLEMAHMEDYDDQEKQQELLLLLYTNLLVCYTKIEEPRRACVNFNKINEIVRGTDIQISAKCFYNNAKCLRMLGDFALAKKRLDKAYKLEPKNPEILAEMVALEEEQKKYKKKRRYAYGMLGCLNRVPPDSEVLFEIKLIEIIDFAAATSFQNLPPDQQKQFAFVYDYCLALCAKGKDLY